VDRAEEPAKWAEVEEEALAIYNEYIKPGSPSEINIPST
jgi:hypothetical protein